MSPLSYTAESLQALLLDLGVDLSRPLLRLLSWLMLALLENTRAHLFRLADKLPDDETSDRARRQRVRRFLSNPRVVVKHFLPVLLRLLKPLLVRMPQITLSLDRTSWSKRKQVVTILSVGLVGEGYCIPLHWIVLDRAGNTAQTHWQEVLTPRDTTKHLLDTRRSHRGRGRPRVRSPKLSEWLWLTYRVESALRAKRSEYLRYHQTCQQVAKWLEPMKPGECRFLQLTRGCGFTMNVLLLWRKGYKEPWVIMTTQSRYPDAYHSYRCRWAIEPMHRNWKSYAFDIEGTRVTKPERIARLLLPIAL